MSRNFISIITPCYNGERFLKECIDSVINQTYVDWEMIIVDDNSDDKSVAIIEKLSLNEDRIKPIYLDDNVGPAQARNIALSNSKGRFIAFLDADDMWHKEKLNTQVAFMLDKGIAFTYTAYEIINEIGVNMNKTINIPTSIGYHSYLKNTIIGCLTVMIDRDIVGDFKMPNIRSSHDMALWLLIIKRGFRAYGITKSLAYYRVVGTSNTSNKFKAAKDVWSVYRREEELSILYSAICFICYVFNAIKKRI
ncbi:MAG: glycosyl transferase [Flavobacteriales bacterium]|nr:glycosyl transferase [Flavobacteriales bacterium]